MNWSPQPSGQAKCTVTLLQEPSETHFWGRALENALGGHNGARADGGESVGRQVQALATNVAAQDAQRPSQEALALVAILVDPSRDDAPPKMNDGWVH